jgi:hypothetical protein
MSGLNRSYNHLKRVGLNVLNLDFSDMSNYADKVCIENVNAEWLKGQVMETDFTGVNAEALNATSFGNLAYVALHSDDKNVSERATYLIRQARQLFI